MKNKILLTLIICLNLSLTHGQNEKPNREKFTLNLPSDGEHSYRQEIEASPYFRDENVLQLYPGETLFVEAEVEKNAIKSMKVVRENVIPESTITISLTQIVVDSKNKGMMLEIMNPFKKSIEYDASMHIIGNAEAIPTTTLPILAKTSGVELWRDLVVSLILSNWQLKY